MIRVGKLLVLLGVAACLAIAATGCGSSSDSTSSSTAAAGDETGGSATSGPGSGGGDGKSSDGKSGGDDSKSGSGDGKSGNGDGTSASGDGKSSGGDGSTGGGDGSKGSGSISGGSGSSKKNAGSGGPKTNDNGAPLGADTAKNGDNSIESYGTEAEGPERAAVLAAMRSFDLAVASRDYGGVCAGLAGKIRGGLAESNKSCPQLLETLMIIPPAEAQNAANGSVTEVRVGGGNAFVLFRPAGGSEVKYFVMTLEGGGWKSLGLTVGTPLDPSNPAG
jgi:hypothetical protein